MTKHDSTHTMLAVLLIAAVLIAGCSVHEDTYYRNRAAIRALGARPHLQGAHRFGGLAIDFDAISGWTRAHGNQQVFAAYKTHSVPLYSSALVVVILHPPKTQYQNDQAFIAAAKKAYPLGRPHEIKRLALTMEPGVGKWKSCLKYYKKFTTIDKINAPLMALIEQQTGYICRDPYRHDRFVRIDYSERYPASMHIEQFSQRAEQLWKSVKFTED